ncbi:MAG: transposase domain-containing protein [Cytophagales bacterium]|nr:transposase domain-containing protein [Cytophagales bacterium]
MIYSLPGTCKLNGIEPFSWLREVLWKIPDTKLTNLHRLLPIKSNLKKV